MLDALEKIAEKPSDRVKPALCSLLRDVKIDTLKRVEHPARTEFGKGHHWEVDLSFRAGTAAASSSVVPPPPPPGRQALQSATSKRPPEVCPLESAVRAAAISPSDIPVPLSAAPGSPRSDSDTGDTRRVRSRSPRR